MTSESKRVANKEKHSECKAVFYKINAYQAKNRENKDANHNDYHRGKIHNIR